ncbi:MAG TPA: sigma-70 family RNA polymerase sigma factor, partial [Chthonomonadales bacterium]|nr:sigma-70 family RNA polymerase sigma factor [Chthonomonadales bacterium]
RDSWDRLVKLYFEPLFRFCYSLCHNYEEAGDLTSQTLVRLYEALHTFRGDSSFTTWLFHIARNLYLDQHVRPGLAARQVSLDATVARELPDSAPTPEAQLIRNEQKRALHNAIVKLPGYQREVMEMAHIRGRQYEEIAAETGIPLGTVKSRMNRARRSLKERLELE